VIDNPRILRRAERRLRKAQQTLSRKAKGSRNRAKARRKVAKAHAKVSDTRRDWLHKKTTGLVRENQALYLEDLNVRGLARTRLAKSVHDASAPAGDHRQAGGNPRPLGQGGCQLRAVPDDHAAGLSARR
jgi:transposase